MVPFKRFSRFHLIALKCDAHDGSWVEADHWTTEVDNAAYNYCYLFNSVTRHSARWDFAFRGYEEDGWEEAANLDRIAFVKMKVYLHTPWINSVPVTKVRFTHGALDDPAAFGAANQFDPDTGCGRYYKDVEQWENYPAEHEPSAGWSIVNSDILVADMPGNFNFYYEAWNNTGAGSPCLIFGQNIFEKGFSFRSLIYTPNLAVWASLKGFGVNVDIQETEIHYHNPFTNSFDRYTMPTTGGQLVLTGLGYKNSNADLGEGCVVPLQDWQDRVDHIYVEDIHGNVVATLHETLWYPPFTVHEYTCDSNTQITIQSFPALSAGVYCLRLEKVFPAPYQATTCYGYAGDNRTYPTGEIHAGERLWICVGDECGPGKKPVTFTKWRWRKGDNYIFRYYAPIDVRSSLIFYEGMILGISGFERGTNDLTGLPVFGDIQLELDNTSQEFSKLLAEYWIKNQPVEIYVGYQEEPEIWKEIVFKGFVSDYEKPGSTWRVTLRDVMEKFFDVKLPRFICSKSEYPNIHPNHEGKEMPEVLGLGQLNTGSSPGAVEAIYVDTTTFKYLAAHGSLHDIIAVYSDSDLVAPADYTITYADGGRTYITFDNDQGDNKITFDCEGYMYDDWNSADDYVQNPAYVMLFVLAFLAEIPAEEIDLESFDDLADLYDSLGYSSNAYLILQDAKGAATVMQELFFTFGAKCWKAKDGRITVGRKDPTDFTPVAHLFEQIDAMEEPSRPVGFNEAVNYAPIKWQFFPTANYHKWSDLAVRQSSIDAFEANIMPSPEWNYPWTDDADVVNMRATEDLLKLGFGDQRIRLKLSIEHIDTLDILDNFRYQDPFGLNALGLGEVGRYFYVEKIGYDLLAGTMNVEGIDLQWVLQQIMILGDSTTLAANWSTATETERLYGYLADSADCKFADGEPGKILINCGG